MASDNKYDRQLRLWGRNGQRALVESRILLLGASCTGSETLKNLVLPGCGSITIVDDAVVSAADVASNFFVRRSDLGRPRCEVVKELLVHMNPDTAAAEHVVQSPAGFVSSFKDNIGRFTLVVATQMAEAPVRELAAACEAHGVPLLVVRTYGLIGYVRAVTPRCGHPIAQSHPDRDTSDQWINNPWPELAQWRDSFDLDAQSAEDHQFTPFPVLLYHLFRRYKQEHGDAAAAALDRATFSAYITQYDEDFRAKIVAAGGQAEAPENYPEAVSQCYKALRPAEPLPDDLRRVLKDPRAAAGAAGAPNPAAGDANAAFWVAAQAINRFMAQEGRGFLPVTGKVEDMTASSEMYIAMQNQHVAKHARDVAAVRAHFDQIVAEGGADLAGALNTLPFADDVQGLVELVCKNIRELALTLSTSLAAELTNTAVDEHGQTQPAAELGQACMMAPFDPESDPEMLGAVWYIMLRACDRFAVASGRFPGADPDASAESLDADAKALERVATELATELSVMWDKGFAKPAAEMTRYGATEIHTVAAYIGGVAGQEAVKLISHQYTPLNSTLIYNGINGNGFRYSI